MDKLESKNGKTLSMDLRGEPAPWAVDKYLDSVFSMFDIKRRQEKQSGVTQIGAGSTDKDSGQNTLADK